MKRNNAIQLCIIFLLMVTEVHGEDQTAIIFPLKGRLYMINALPPGPLPSNTVRSKTGEVWMDRNLGASQVATAINDGLSYGDLYQWGRLTDGHEKREPLSGTTVDLATSHIPGHDKFILSSGNDWLETPNDSLWLGVYGINNPCPAGFRLPTKTEWQNEIDAYGTSGTALFESVLKLPAAGYRLVGIGPNSGKLMYEETRGTYWSRTPV
ncbi:MAG: hypothetical protein D3923_13640, partial [Candidatus Electrothrix sp. AR3]|nr:hypothetical protein [Candidatus Electrothrix sp. AR3]